MTRDAVASAGQERLGLLVVGMHRSGTSAATRIISLLGPQLPSNLMPASEEFNAAGFWESLDVVALDEKLLAAAQSAWDDVVPVDVAGLPSGALASFHEEAGNLLRKEFGTSGWFVLKDPRIGRLLAPWLEAVRAAGARPLVVLPVRHPAEVAASLQRREGFSEDKSFYLWVRHQVDVLRSSRAETRGIVIYDELMADWRDAMQRLAHDLAIRWPRAFEEVAAEADGFLDAGLRHHQVHAAPAPRSLPERLAHELYEALCKRSPGLDALADSIDQQLAPAEALFAPLQRDAVRRVALAKAAREQQRLASEQQQDELRERIRHIALLTEEVAALNEDRARAAAKLAEFEATVRDERAAHAHLAAEFDAKARHVQVLEQECADLAAQRDRGVARIRELEDTLASERATFAQLSTSFQEKVQHVQVLEQERADLAAQRGRGLARIRELEDTLESERAAFAQLSASFAEKERHLLAVTGQLQESENRHERVQGQLQESENRHERVQGQLQELQSRHDVLQARVKELGDALEEARVAIASIDMALS